MTCPPAHICKITPPTDGTSGTSVYGQELKARNGRKCRSRGERGNFRRRTGRYNHRFGNLVFRNGHFTVDEIFRVQDVDYDIGNGYGRLGWRLLGDAEVHAGQHLPCAVGSTVLEKPGGRVIEQGINGTGKAEIPTGKNRDGRVYKLPFAPGKAWWPVPSSTAP